MSFMVLTSFHVGSFSLSRAMHVFTQMLTSSLRSLRCSERLLPKSEACLALVVRMSEPERKER